MNPIVHADGALFVTGSERVRRHRFAVRGQAALRATSALTGAALAGSALMGGSALALPQGGTVVEGDATITYSDTSVVIEQSSSHVIIEWDSFDTAAGETVHFDQSSHSWRHSTASCRARRLGSTAR